jgi:hypothetical protein
MYYLCIVVPVIPLPVLMLVMKPGFLFCISKVIRRTVIFSELIKPAFFKVFFLERSYFDFAQYKFYRCPAGKHGFDADFYQRSSALRSIRVDPRSIYLPSTRLRISIILSATSPVLFLNNRELRSSLKFRFSKSRRMLFICFWGLGIYNELSGNWLYSRCVK